MTRGYIPESWSPWWRPGISKWIKASSWLKCIDGWTGESLNHWRPITILLQSAPEGEYWEIKYPALTVQKNHGKPNTFPTKRVMFLSLGSGSRHLLNLNILQVFLVGSLAGIFGEEPKNWSGRIRSTWVSVRLLSSLFSHVHSKINTDCKRESICLLVYKQHIIIPEHYTVIKIHSSWLF